MISSIISKFSISRIQTTLLKRTISYSKICSSLFNCAALVSKVEIKPNSIWSGNYSSRLFGSIPFHFREMLPTPSPNLQQVRFMNRNARWPKKANHGKRPVCHSRRRIKKQMVKSRAYKKKIFGFW